MVVIFRGNRVTAMIKAKAFSNLALVDRYCMYPVPDKWTLEEAVTVPVVYGTVLYAFFMVTLLERTFRSSRDGFVEDENQTGSEHFDTLGKRRRGAGRHMGRSLSRMHGFHDGRDERKT